MAFQTTLKSAIFPGVLTRVSAPEIGKVSERFPNRVSMIIPVFAISPYQHPLLASASRDAFWSYYWGVIRHAAFVAARVEGNGDFFIRAFFDHVGIEKTSPSISIEKVNL
jgi:hypothetical protein